MTVKRKKTNAKANSSNSKTGTPKGQPKTAKSKKSTASKTAKSVVNKTKVNKPKAVSGRLKKDKMSKEKEIVSKVKEIISKSSAKGNTEEEAKQESRAFTLDDVRNILSSKSKSSVDKTNKLSKKAEKVTKSPKKKSSAKVKKLTTASIDDILGFGAPTSALPAKPIRDPQKVPKEWKSYYSDLMKLRSALKGALDERSSETIGASARESSGELSLNSSDAGTETFDRDVALSMVANEQDALNEIEDAIDRIFDGSFGICQETQKPIKKNRLKAVPFTRFSLEGQDQHEKRMKKEGGSSGGAFATIADSTLGTED